MGNRLYVGNLSYDANADAVRTCFAEIGDVSEVHMVMDRETGRSRGFAFVTMSTHESAQNAIAQLNGAMLGGRPLRVSEAEERNNRGGGGGGGGGARVFDGNGDRNHRGGHRGW